MDLNPESQSELSQAEALIGQATLYDTEFDTHDGRLAAALNSAIYFMLRAVLAEISTLRRELSERADRKP